MEKTYSPSIEFIFGVRDELPILLGVIPFGMIYGVPELLIRNNHFVPANPRLLAGALAAGVAWRTKNVILTIVAGMAALLLIQFL